MAKKKLTTQEILAAARAEAARKKGGQPPDEQAASQEPDAPEQQNASEKQETPEAEAAEATSDAAADSEEVREKKPAPKPSGGAKLSTKDILAAARAQAATGGAKKAEPLSGEESKKPAAPAKKPAAGGAPKSTKDILAAARAQAAGGSAEKSKPAPAAKKTAAAGKAAQPAAASGERPSVQEMLKAVREGAKPAAEEEEAPAREFRKPKKPVPSPKPGAKVPAKQAERRATRRNFLLAMLLAMLSPFAWLVATPFAAAWTMFTAATAVLTLGLARFMMPNVINVPPTRFKVGPPADYPLGTVATKWKQQYGIWLAHSEYQGENILYALISVCTHLGCTPNWLEGDQKFKCPCHGSGFYATGINFEGPAPRPLERAGIRVAPDGMLEVDKSVKFQQELGQWDDAASKVVVT